MATGVKPRDEETQFTRSDLEAIQDAMKSKKFRELFAEYCEEVRDPANQALYQKEMVQLEKERGYDVTFLNPKGSYVIKTSVAGDRKAFINICSNENVGKPSYKVQEVNGKRGMNWLIPYSLIPPREDYDSKRVRCVIYDVVFHPDTLRMAQVNRQFRDLVNKTAFDGLEKTFNIDLDNNNFRFPKSYYKGMTTPAVIRKEDPSYKPPDEEESEKLSPEMMEKLYPQRSYSTETEPVKNTKSKEKSKPRNEKKKAGNEVTPPNSEGYIVPKYIIKQQKNVDMQDYTYDRDCKQYSAIPSQISVEIFLPLLSSTRDCILDVQEKTLSLTSEKPAKYKLNITLPYSVNDECGNAKFDKTKHKLLVTLPVITRNLTSERSNSIDDGVGSEESSSTQSDEDNSNMVQEISYTPLETPALPSDIPKPRNSESFLDPSLNYTLPAYTHNVLDDVIAFTFHVKNTDPDSVVVKNDDKQISVKFTTIGSGFVPVHYAAIISFENSYTFNNVSGEAWDNNVILQLELANAVPEKFQIGLDTDTMTTEYFELSQVNNDTETPSKSTEENVEETEAPIVEVANLGNETNILVSSNNSEYDEDDSDSPFSNEKDIVWVDSGHCRSSAKSILRKPSTMRSFSESSAGDVASSVDYISSDCIPEESSQKKTVRFNYVIARQFYRYNSSIEGQKKKNQRKKSKKRSLEQRKRESENEDEASSLTNSKSKPVKSVLKQRRDSGLADTSDADTDYKNTPDDHSYVNGNTSKSILNIVDNKCKEEPDFTIRETSNSDQVRKSESVTTANIKHRTDLYNPDNLNKGQYLEVTFKNDLIFDLDM